LKLEFTFEIKITRGERIVMKKDRLILYWLLASTLVAGMRRPGYNTGANNANTNTTKPVAPTAAALMALEKTCQRRLCEGRSSFLGMLSDKFVILGDGQRMDKAATVKNRLGQVRHQVNDLPSRAVDDPTRTRMLSAIRPPGTARATAPTASR